MSSKSIQQLRLAKFFSIRVLGLGDSVGVNYERVPGREPDFRNLAMQASNNPITVEVERSFSTFGAFET